ncbi:MAG: hypothetical protein PVF43_04735 [Candidatus Eiseniibacteriota bacterium]|jgi:hypothetical protein
MTPEPAPQRPYVQHGLRVEGGELCYLCEQPIREGDPAVYYVDAAFWNEIFFYHADCWDAADLAAKQFGHDGLRQGPAVVLHDATCAACGQPIELGDEVVRDPGRFAEVDPATGGAAGLLPRVYHAACHAPGPA